MDFINKIRARFKNETDIIDDPLLKALLNQTGVSRSTAMTLPAVAKNVGLICDLISCIPIKLYKKETDKNGNKKVVEVDDYRTELLNKDTKDTLNGVQFKRAMVEDYLLGKGGYAYINKAGNKVKSIHYVEENKVSILKGVDPIFKYYEIGVNGRYYKDFDFIKVLRNTKDGASGEGVVNQLSTAIESAYETMVYQLALIKRGGSKRGFLQSAKKLSEPAMEQLRTAWAEMYSSNSNNAMVLNDGVEFKEASSSSVELQLNESKTTLNKEIDDIFRYSDDFDKFFKNAIMPILTEFESSINKVLLLEVEKKDLFFRFDTKEITKGSLKERYEAYKLAKEAGWTTPNEIRFEENKEKIEGLDIIAMGLADVIFDTNKGTYFTPNMGDERNLGKGGSNDD